MFDLDGTLLDTLVDLAGSMNAALKQLGFPPHPVDAYKYFVGDSMEMEVRRALPKENLDSQTINKCMALATEEYTRCWAANTKPYPGVPELLSNLQQRNIPMAVLSNKPDDFTQIMVKKLLGSWAFEAVRGLRDSAIKKPDPASSLEIADKLKVDPANFLYLGDTNTDMQTANNAGMYPVGATWGFRTADELLASGAKRLVENPLQVLDLIDNRLQA